tara:strand:- start:446 stop:691 length:246 start_codon:yes stop_codon:yes gene_type:complete
VNKRKKVKRKSPFKRGQKVRYKGTKDRTGRVTSEGWAKIGVYGHTQIFGGPLVLEGLVLVQWWRDGKWDNCIEYIDDLEAC